MGDIGTGISRLLIDQSGDPITDDSSNALKVKLVGSDTINANIGDVDMEFGGVAADVGVGTADGGTLRVTLASNDVRMVALEADVESIGTTLTTMNTTLSSTIYTDDGDWINNTSKHLLIGGLFQDSMQVVTDGDVAPLQVNNNGVLKVDVSGRYGSLPVGSNTIGKADIELAGTAIDGNSGSKSGGTIRIVIADDDPHFGGLGGAADADGTIHGQLRHMANNLGTIATETGDSDNKLNTLNTYIAALLVETGTQYSEGNVHTTAIVRNDLLASLATDDHDYAPLQVNAAGALYTSHDITGGAHGVKVVSSAGTDVVLGGDVACRKIDIQAQTDNTGLIAVGFSGVDATEATGTGIILYPGDTYSLEITNLTAIYIDSTVSGEGVRYTYYR